MTTSPPPCARAACSGRWIRGSLWVSPGAIHPPFAGPSVQTSLPHSPSRSHSDLLGAGLDAPCAPAPAVGLGPVPEGVGATTARRPQGPRGE